MFSLGVPEQNAIISKHNIDLFAQGGGKVLTAR